MIYPLVTFLVKIDVDPGPLQRLVSLLPAVKSEVQTWGSTCVTERPPASLHVMTRRLDVKAPRLIDLMARSKT